jgi:peptide-methionine (R)-S-oxide reductase
MTRQRDFSRVQNASLPSVQRRALLGGGIAALACAIAPKLRAASAPAPAANQEVPIEMFTAAGKSTGIVRVARLVRTEAEWRAQLSPLAYQVTRQEGTERAYTGEYASSHGDGLYRCICCATALYDSKCKYESGTGWPSFWKPISSVNIVRGADPAVVWLGHTISCRRCDAHLGHVFEDGPPPTGLRYCMNSVALHFVSRA